MTPEAVRAYFEAEPMALFIALCAVVAGVCAISEVKRLQRVFDILPTIFWIYFVPMLLATLGFFPEKSPAFTFIRDYLLPSSLLLLLLSASIPEMAKLGPRALLVMFSATAGIAIGAAVATFAIVPLFSAGVLPEHHLESVWKGIAALSGSWTGGSGNMAAIWESLAGENKTEAEKQIYSAMLAVDVCIGYSWMAFLIALAGRQGRINQWLRADSKLIDDVNRRMQAVADAESRRPETGKFVYMIALALAVAFICRWIGAELNTALSSSIQDPLWKSVFSAYAIMIVCVTVVGLTLSLTPAAKLEGYGASKLAYALLYVVLARIGAEGNLNVIRAFPGYLVLGIVWIGVHGLIVLAVLKWLRAPLFFGVTASQANVGGTVSAPVVAAAHQPGLAIVGLLMAIIGNIMATFMGLFIIAPLAHWATRLGM